MSNPSLDITYAVVITRIDDSENVTNVEFTDDNTVLLRNLTPQATYIVTVGPGRPDDWTGMMSDSVTIETPRELPSPVILAKTYNATVNENEINISYTH